MPLDKTRIKEAYRWRQLRLNMGPATAEALTTPLKVLDGGHAVRANGLNPVKVFKKNFAAPQCLVSPAELLALFGPAEHLQKSAVDRGFKYRNIFLIVVCLFFYSQIFIFPRCGLRTS